VWRCCGLVHLVTVRPFLLLLPLSSSLFFFLLACARVTWCVCGAQRLPHAKLLCLQHVWHRWHRSRHVVQSAVETHAWRSKACTTRTHACMCALLQRRFFLFPFPRALAHVGLAPPLARSLGHACNPRCCHLLVVAGSVLMPWSIHVCACAYMVDLCCATGSFNNARR
jgi:hypothetical protein